MTSKSESIILISNSTEFEQLFRKQYAMLCNIAKRFVGNMQSAEEIVQDVFVKVWEKGIHEHFEGSIEAYLVTSVKNSSLNYLKHQKIIQSSEKKVREINYPNDVQFADELVNAELGVLIDNAISKLPEQRKKVFKYSRFEGLKYNEIAEKMGLSVKTIEVQMCKALSFLRIELKEYIK